MTLTEFFFETIHGVDFNVGTKPIITSEDIDIAVKELTGFTRSDLSTCSRKSEKVIARWTVMYLYYKIGKTKMQISRELNRRHCTVIHAINEIDKYNGSKMYPEMTEFVKRVSQLTGIAI